MNSIRHMMVLLDQYREGLVAPTELLLGMQLSPAQLHLVNSVHALPENVRQQIPFLSLEPDSDYEDYWQSYGKRLGLVEPSVPPLRLQACHSYERRDGTPVIVEFNSDRGFFYVEWLKGVEWYDGSGKHLATEDRAADAQLDLVKEIDRKSYVRTKPQASVAPAKAESEIHVKSGYPYLRRDGERVLVQYSDRWDLFYSGPRSDTNWYNLQGKNQSDGRTIADPQRDLIEELEPAEAQIDKSVPAPKAGQYPRMIEGQHYMRRDGVMVQLDYNSADGQWFVENEQEERYVYDSRGRCAGEEGGDSEEATNGRYDLVRLLTPDEVWAERQKTKDSRNEVQADIWYPVGVLPLWAKMIRHASLMDMYQSNALSFVGHGIPVGLVWNASGVCVDCDSSEQAFNKKPFNLDLAEGQSSLPCDVQDDHWYWVESGSGRTRKHGWLRVTTSGDNGGSFASDALPAVRWNLDGIAHHSNDRGWVRMRSAHISPATGRETLPSGARLFTKD